MPKVEPKAIQRELEQGLIWPFYWIYGPEKLKSRELLKRIRQAVLGSAQTDEESGPRWNEESFDGGEVDVSTILDAAQSLTLGGGVKLIVVRDAHAIKNLEALAELLGPAQKLSELFSVCVCLAKDLDGRKKFSKTLVDQAAVIACDEVAEAQRESWIQYLSKRRNLELNPEWVVKLSTLDPWSLDIIDQELEKLSLAGMSSDVILDGGGELGGSEVFLDHFFSRELKSSLPWASRLAESPDEALPLLGLLTWNVRQLAVLIADRENGTRHAKINPYLADRFRKWSSKWTLGEILRLQKELFEIDFSLKQTPLLPLGLWSQLVTHFCT